MSEFVFYHSANSVLVSFGDLNVWVRKIFLNRMSAVSKVPVEVLEHIFSFLDGHSFCSVKHVCRSWYEVGKKMQGRKWLWKQFCIQEIPSSILEELLAFKSVPAKDKIIDWNTIYRKWCVGKMIKHPYHNQKYVQAYYSDPISTMKLSGSYVITGHISGMLCVWNSHSGDLHQKVRCHLKMITDMVLVDLLNHGTYGREELPWLTSYHHHHIITVSKDSYIHVKSLLEPFSNIGTDVVLNYHSDVICYVRMFGDKFAASSRDNTLSLWSMKVEKPFHLQISMLHRIIGPPDIILTIGFWHDKVQCLSHAGKLKAFCPEFNSWLEIKDFKESYSANGSESVVSVTHAFVFRSQVIMLLTADGKLVLSINGLNNKHYQLMKTLKTELVTVSLFGTILALGGENGKLFLYHVANDMQLMELDLTKPDLALYLSEASIISIDISYNWNSPVIAATTTESIYIVEWDRHSNIHQELKLRSLNYIFPP